MSSLLQDLATAERFKRQAQTERDELQDEINNSNSKKYEPNFNCYFSATILVKLTEDTPKCISGTETVNILH